MTHAITRRTFLGGCLLSGPAARLISATRPAPHALPFRLGIITDEIAQDFQAALAFITHYSLHYAELRELWSKNIMNLGRSELQRARELLEQHQIRVSDIASPIFKYNLPHLPARPEKHDTFHANFTDQDSDSLLERSFELARFLGTSKVRVFSYWRVDDPERAYPYVRDRLAKAAEVAGRHGMLLVLENEHECNVGTGKELGRILRDVNSPHLRGNWDPGNAVMLGETPYPDGYREVKGLFAHVHVKDAKRLPSGQIAWAPVGSGFIDWRGQFQALRQDGYDGTISLETHYRRADGNAMESTRESLEGLLKVIGDSA